MALLILPCGTFIEKYPSDTLDDWQNAVEGYVEAIHLRNGDTMLVNEEGMLLNLPLNEYASSYADNTHVIFGRALILSPEEWENANV